jgi:hypothetical protein
MAQSTYDILKDFGVPLATLVVGFISGIRTTIYTDRRNEFNKVVGDLYFRIKSQIEAESIGVDSFDIDIIEHHMPWYKKKSFRKCAERYRESQQGVSEYHPETGSVTVDEAAKAKMLKCAKDALLYLKPR